MMRPQPPTRRQAAVYVALFVAYAVVAYVATIPTLFVSLIAATIASWAFLVTYVTTTRWEQHTTGWNMVLMSASVTGLLTLAMVPLVAPGLAYYLGTFLYAGLALSSAWLVRTLRRVQREGNNPLLDRSVDLDDTSSPRQ